MVKLRTNFLVIAFFTLLASASFAASPYFFRGYAHVNGSLAPNGTIVEVYLNGTSTVLGSAIVGEGALGGTPQGWYTLGFEANSGDKVAFRVNNLTPIAGNGTNVTAQTLSAVIVDNFNLSVNKSSNGVGCLYAIGCSSGFCVDSYCCNSACSGASEDCNVAGSIGTCTSTASSSSGSTGGGGGGGAASTTSESVTIPTVTAGVTATVSISASVSSSIGVEKIEFTPTATITDVKVTVKETTAAEAKVPVAISSSSGAVYKYLEITKVNIQDSQISSAKINFKVPKTWIASNGIDKSTVSLNRFVNNGWSKLSTQLVREDTLYVYYSSPTQSFSTFAVTGEKGIAFFDLISKIDDYYKGRIAFFTLIDSIDLYYKSQR